MAFKDFRDYLGHLEKNGKLAHVTRPVDPKFGIAAGIRKTSDIDGPALLYENITGHPGWRVAAGLYSTQKLMALAMGLPITATEDQLLHHYIDCQERRVPPRMVSTGPVKEIVLKDGDVDLGTLPIPTYSELDPGPYLTAGIEIARDPETGRFAASIHRRKLLSRDTTGLLAPGFQRLHWMVRRAEQKGKSLEIATVLGVDPALTIATQVKVPLTVDKQPLETAGGFRGAPLELVRCETIDLAVPANAEVVIEGHTVPGERISDGPFGEYPGNYLTTGWEVAREAFVVKVTAITMRRNPIFQAMLTGMPMTDNHWLKKWSLAAAAFKVARDLADVVSVNVTAGGTAQYHVVVSLRKSGEAEPRNIIRALLSHRLGARLVTVVDDDIDVYDPVQVEWAVSTRTWPQRDVYIFPPAYRGPGAPPPSVAWLGQWGIDATMPLNEREGLKRIVVPGVEDVDYI